MDVTMQIWSPEQYVQCIPGHQTLFPGCHMTFNNYYPARMCN